MLDISKKPILEVEALTVNYGSRAVLRGIDISVEKGEILAVVGPNGAGKTTLIRAISGIIPPNAGEIRVAGEDLTQLSPAQRARHIAVVPQARNLPGGYTVQQTVLMGRNPYLGWLGRIQPADRALVQQALTHTHTLYLSDRRVGELSGGEQQRVLLARALAQATPILLLDEPTAHLDLQHQSVLLNLVSASTRELGLAVLLAAHDLNMVALYADRVALLVDGCIRALGAPEEVLTRANIEAAYHISVRIIRHPDYGTPLILPDGHQPAHTLINPPDKALPEKRHESRSFTQPPTKS
jgi:iron complex transport system ATP-binding protein